MAEKQRGSKPPKSPGRPRGVPNKTTTVLKEAILVAAGQVGSDGEGRDGLTGYLRHVAQNDIKAFSGLLGKVLPMQLTGDLQVSVTTKEQRDAAVAAATRADR